MRQESVDKAAAIHVRFADSRPGDVPFPVVVAGLLQIQVFQQRCRGGKMLRRLGIFRATINADLSQENQSEIQSEIAAQHCNRPERPFKLIAWNAIIADFSKIVSFR